MGGDTLSAGIQVHHALGRHDVQPPIRAQLPNPFLSYASRIEEDGNDDCEEGQGGGEGAEED